MLQGSSNRLRYDDCAYQKRLFESTSPLLYNLYEGKFENCNKCIYDKFYRPYDLVDYESELLNITRPTTQCDQYKYSATCQRSDMCISTYDRDAPVIFAPEICPIVHNNIPKMVHPGYTLDESAYLLKCDR